MLTTCSCVVKVFGAPPDPVQPQPPDVKIVNIFVLPLCVNPDKQVNTIIAIIE
jgi:hypothetical protein